MSNGVTNKDLYDSINGFRLEAKAEYVTKDEFRPVKNVVYGMAAMVLVAFMTFLVAIAYPSTRKTLTPQTTATVTSPTPSPPSSANPPTASATSHSDSTTPSDSQVSSSGGLVSDTLKQVGL